MKARKMLAVGTILLMSVGLLAQAGAEHGKKMAASAQQTMASGGDEQALVDIENKWVEAGKKQDPTMLEPYLASGFMSMGSDGAYTARKDYLASIKNSKWEISEINNVKAHVSGNHAVVTGDWRGKGKDGSGKSVDTTEHWIDSFVKSGGKWQCTTDASTTAKK